MNRYFVPGSPIDTARTISHRLHSRRTWLRDLAFDAYDPRKAELRQQMAAFDDAIAIVDEVIATLDRGAT